MQSQDASGNTRLQIPTTGDSMVVTVSDSTPGVIKLGSDHVIYANNTNDALRIQPQSDAHGSLYLGDSAGASSKRYLNIYGAATTGISLICGSDSSPAYDATKITFNKDTLTLQGRDSGTIGSLAISSSGLVTKGEVKPTADNTDACGTADNRWSDVRSVLINGADIALANGWKLREYPCSPENISQLDAWMKKNANQGVQFLNDKDEIMMVLHRGGNLYVAGEVHPLSELKG